jgi:hypothetical protein
MPRRLLFSTAADYHYGVEFLAVDNTQRQCVDQLRMHLASFAIIA